MSDNFFDYLNAINQSKENLTADEAGERGYIPFMVNRGLGYFKDTVFQANEMNRLNHLDKRLQNEFLLNSVSARKRFSKWFKADKPDDLEVVREYYGYSTVKARTALKILTPDQLAYLKEKLFKGGLDGTKQ